jgi:hypothetical protein
MKPLERIQQLTDQDPSPKLRAMVLKLIACNVFQREVCLCLARTPHVIDLEFTELGEHANSGGLRQSIQSKIDATEITGKKYEAILILFGLCGNSTSGLFARQTPLIVPRAHDCCTILLGSKQRFEEHFKEAPSTPFSSVGYMERGDYFLRTDGGNPTLEYGDPYAKLIEQYGEEDAKYIWETMHPPALDHGTGRAVFIDIPETTPREMVEQFKEKATAAGKECVHMQGSLHLIQHLVDGHWDNSDFLTVPPGYKTAGVYDWSEIVRATPAT